MNEYYAELKKRTLLMIDESDGIDIEDKVKEAEARLVLLMKVRKYGGKDGVEVKMMKEFEKTCNVLRDNKTKEPKEMTVFEFYSTLDYLNDKQKKIGRKSNIHK